MQEQTIASTGGVGTTKICTDIVSLKLRMAEHILAQYDYAGTTDVRDILNETKTGAWRRPALEKIIKMVFSAA